MESILQIEHRHCAIKRDGGGGEGEFIFFFQHAIAPQTTALTTPNDTTVATTGEASRSGITPD